MRKHLLCVFLLLLLGSSDLFAKQFNNAIGNLNSAYESFLAKHIPKD